MVKQPIVEVFRRDWRSFLLAVGITVSEVGLAYLLTVFVINYSTILGLPRQVVLNAVVYAALVEFITLPLAGWLSDVFGRKALYMTGALASIAVAFPFFWLFETKDTTIITITLIVTMTLTHALLFGPKAAYLPELFGTRIRYSGAALGAEYRVRDKWRIFSSNRNGAPGMGRCVMGGFRFHHRALSNHRIVSALCARTRAHAAEILVLLSGRVQLNGLPAFIIFNRFNQIERWGMSKSGQKWKYSLRVNVFRCSSAGSTGRRNTGVKSLCWRFKLQGLTWSFV